MPRMIVGLVKTTDQTSTAEVEDAEVEAMLAQASYIVNNPAEFLVDDDEVPAVAGVAETEAVLV